MPGPVDSAVVSRDAALAVNGDETTQRHSCTVAKRGQSVTGAAICRKEVESWVPPRWECLSGWELIAVGQKQKAIEKLSSSVGMMSF